MGRRNRAPIRKAAVGLAVVGSAYLVTQIRPFEAAADRSPSLAVPSPQPTASPTAPVAPLASVVVTRYDFDPSHPDFNLEPADGGGRYVGIVAPQLDTDGKPAFKSTGHNVLEDWTDEQGNPIAPPNEYAPATPGDQPGALSPREGGAVTSAETFSRWFRATPGVNRRSEGAMSFETTPDGSYVLNAPLDTLADGNTYTAELGWTFIHEPGHDAFLTIETDAEAWVYIDGELVIDGGGIGDSIDFSIEDGVVIPAEPFFPHILVPGAAVHSSSYHNPVTMRAHFGADTLDPFGPFDNPVLGNINDDQDVTAHANPGDNPRLYAAETGFPAGTPITVAGRSWVKKYYSYSGLSASHWDVQLEGDTADHTPQISVLRDGDPVPDNEGTSGAGNVTPFLADYIDSGDNTVRLAPNQVIYLMELGVSADSPSADFRDLVAVLTLAAESSGANEATGANDLVSAPRLKQTIDLSRLDWLEDRHPYPVRVFYANRTGGASDLRIETNLRPRNDR